ncbi:hypothetical protein RJ639_023343 [Escallonia herrerae]|uniref:SCP domain-containing protein n=1 Tax=Escallonia herrerae TaxID=1293975 RepID=A0AA88UZR3_9ASTE|nr:hypothetical protein RJ639_023343 [Escallonia herrerae]
MSSLRGPETYANSMKLILLTPPLLFLCGFRVCEKVCEKLEQLCNEHFSISHAQNSPQDYLDAHNSASANVGVGAMTWDNTVAAYAQNYANQRIGDCNLVHSGGPYGENLAKGSGTFTGSSATMVGGSSSAATILLAIMLGSDLTSEATCSK